MADGKLLMKNMKRDTKFRIVLAVLLLFVIIQTDVVHAQEQKRTDITIFEGASFQIINNDKLGNVIVFHNTYNRRVDLWLIKDGDLINRATCYRGDVCYLGNIKLKINIIFYGREANFIKFDILKVF